MRVAVLIPCHNEAQTIASVVSCAREALPGARIIVGDNNSTDGTAGIALALGAEVIEESRQGKGYMVRRMFRAIDADWYVLVDGDATYDLRDAPAMIERAVSMGCDLINGERRPLAQDAFPRGHALGNKVLTRSVALIFGSGIHDMLSGYKVISRRFVASFPALSTGFDLETEIAVHALECGLCVDCMATNYRCRPPGSSSKLSTLRDGLRIGRTILALVRHERPFVFFGGIAAVLCAASLAVGIPVFVDYLHTGLVARFPTAILSMGMMLAAGGALLAGVIGDAITRGRREARMLAYLFASKGGSGPLQESQ